MSRSRFFAIGPILFLAAAATGPGVRPGDDKLTCAEIGAELEPAARQMMAGMGDLGAIRAPMEQRAREGRQEIKERTAIAAGCLAANVAGALATAGMLGNACAASDKAYEMRDRARAPQRKVEDARMMAGLEQATANMNAQGSTLDRPRIDRLMALAEAKQCN